MFIPLSQIWKKLYSNNTFMDRTWSQLRPLSKLDQLEETIMKTAFLHSENHHVIQSY